MAISEIGASRILKRGTRCSNERLFRRLSHGRLISTASIFWIPGFSFADGQDRRKLMSSGGISR